MITKKLFVETLENIIKERDKISHFNNALHNVCDGYPILMLGDGYLNSLLNVLNAVFSEENEKYPTIEWWLFEDVEKKIWETDKVTGEDIEYDVSTPEALYDYLVKNRK